MPLAVMRASGEHCEMRAGTAATALAVLATLVGCTGAQPDGPSATSDRASIAASTLTGVRAEIRQARSDWAARVVQVRVYNDGSAPVLVSGVVLTTPGVVGSASARPKAPPTVAPGDDRDVSVALGAPVCASTEGPAHVVVLLVDAAGATADLPLVAADPQGHLARIRGEDCAAQAVAGGATLSLGSQVEVSHRGGSLVGSLDLTVVPIPGGPTISVTQLDGTVLLAPLVGGAAAAVWTPPELTVPTTEPVTVPLTFTAARCDPHAVAEDKRGTFIAVHTDVDGVPQHVFYLGVDDTTRGQIHDFIGQACGW